MHPDVLRAAWRKSSYTGEQGECVELAPLSSDVAVRDSKDPAGPILRFDRSAFAAFINQARDGRLDF